MSIFGLNSDYKNRVFGLDLMRALAILFVVIGHGGFILEKTQTGFPWIRLMDGVELFFVLSGFLIGGILIKIFMKSPSYGLKEIKSFWIRRWFRTLPNYYLILILNIVFVYFGIIKEDFSQFNWKFFVFLQNFSWPFTGFFWESWSLSIEEWFYLLFPLVLFIIFRLLVIFQIDRKKIFLLSIILFLFTPILLRVFVATKINVDHFWLHAKIFKVVVYRLDGIALGLLASFIKHWYPALWFKSRQINFLFGIFISYWVLYTEWPPNDFFTKAFKISIISSGCFLLLPMFDSIKTAPRPIVKIFTHISLISYSMYLINLALVATVIRDHFSLSSPLEAWTAYFIFWLVVLLASTLIYKYFEKPFTLLRDRFSSN